MSNKILTDELMGIVWGRIVSEVPLDHAYLVEITHKPESCGVGVCMCWPEITVKVLGKVMPVSTRPEYRC